MVPNNGWAALALVIAHAIQRLLDWLAAQKLLLATAQQQTDRDALAQNPADWFDDHFSGVRGSAGKNSAAETGQTNTEHNQDAGRRDVSGSTEHDVAGDLHSGTGDLEQ